MMDEKEIMLEANLTGILSRKRLPKLGENSYLVGIFDLLYEEGRVGEIAISVGEAFDLGDTYHVELKFYPMPIEKFREKMGFRFSPSLSEIKPI